MKTKEAFEKSSKLGSEIRIAHERIEELNIECLKVMEECPHEIVFKYGDNHPRRITVNDTYFCPACGKAIHYLKDSEVSKTCFKDSRIISLDNISILGTKDVLFDMRYEVYKNMELYYNPETTIEELSSRMEDVLKVYAYDYQKYKDFPKIKKIS